MGRESRQTRRKVIEACPSLLGQAIESPMTAPGIADIWMTTCAVECKCLKRYAARPDTPVKLEHPLSRDQFRWLNKRYAAGYPAWVVLQANRTDWYLFAAPDSFVLMPQYALNRVLLKTRALGFWRSYEEMAQPHELQEWLDSSHNFIQQARENRGLQHFEVIV